MRDDWKETEIGNVAKLYQPKTISSKMLVTDGKYDVYGANGIIGKYDKFNHEEEEFLITCRGATCGNVHITKPFSWINGNAMVVKPFDQELLSLEYLKFVFSNKGRIQKAISGSAQPQITRSTLTTIKIPLAPLPEQRAIVAKIEELFSDLDKGIADLKKAQDQLKVYRQAVLKKAFEGELTKEWREQQNDLPTAELLLEQIKEERQKHYIQQVENWKQEVRAWEENGKEGKKPGKPKKEKEFESFKTDIKLNELPNNWNWCDLGEVTSISGGLTKNAKRTSLKIQRPFLRVANVYFDSLELEDMHIIGVKEEEIPRVTLRYGDILLVEGNGSVSQIGRAAIWREEIPNCIHQNHLIKARPFSSINPTYLLQFLCSKMGRDLIIQVASSTSGLHTLNLTKVYNLKVPICSSSEQHQIVQEIESRLSVCYKVEQSLTESLEKAKALRQSILKKAFEGTLLSEEEIAACKAAPDYEPASVLLEKIKAETLRQAQGKKKKK